MKFNLFFSYTQRILNDPINDTEIHSVELVRVRETLFPLNYGRGTKSEIFPPEA